MKYLYLLLVLATTPVLKAQTLSISGRTDTTITIKIDNTVEGQPYDLLVAYGINGGYAPCYAFVGSTNSIYIVQPITNHPEYGFFRTITTF